MCMLFQRASSESVRDLTVVIKQLSFDKQRPNVFDVMRAAAKPTFESFTYRLDITKFQDGYTTTSNKKIS